MVKNRSGLAPVLMVVSGLSMYVGAAIAVGLFELFPPFVVAWLRITSAGLIMAVVLRPSAHSWWGKSGRVAARYGLATAAMNMAFYEAISRMPLGLVVAIEFLGPIAVAAFSSRTVKDWLALVAAGLGVALIAGIQIGGSPLGLFFSFLAAVLWALYIVAGSQLSGIKSPSQGMAVGFTWAGIILCPIPLVTLPAVGSALSSLGWTDFPVISQGVNIPEIVGLSIGLGVLAAVIPYGLDQVILKLVGSGTFAVLLAILPFSASLVGLVFLHQSLTVVEILGIVLVMVAVMLKAPTSAQSDPGRRGRPSQ